MNNKRTYLKRYIIGIFAIAIFLSSCGGVQKEHHSKTEGEATILMENTLTGHLLSMDTQKRELHLDISDWVNRGKKEVEDRMHTNIVIYNESTSFQDEQGMSVRPEDFKLGEKVAIFPASENSNTGVAKKIIQLTMTKEEKLDRLLAKGDEYHTVVLYEEGKRPPYDEMDFEKYVPESFSGGIAWIPYIEGKAIDYKQELDLETLPMILVFDRKGVVFQTASIEQLKSWTDNNR